MRRQCRVLWPRLGSCALDTFRRYCRIPVHSSTCSWRMAPSAALAYIKLDRATVLGECDDEWCSGRRDGWVGAPVWSLEWAVGAASVDAPSQCVREKRATAAVRRDVCVSVCVRVYMCVCVLLLKLSARRELQQCAWKERRARRRGCGAALGSLPVRRAAARSHGWWR